MPDLSLILVALLVVWPLFFGSVSLVCSTYARFFGALGVLGTLLLALLVFTMTNQSWVLGGWFLPLGIGWRLDALARGFILMAAAVGALISLYAWFDGGLSKVFWGVWLGLWGAMNALYLSADLFNVYVALELVAISAVGLLTLSNRVGALQAAMRYLLVSLFASLLFLLAVALVYGQYATLDMRLLAQVVEPVASMPLALALMSAGLVAKLALFPLHSWLPLAHGRATTVVSAILSALVIKVAFYVLARLWLEVFAALQTPTFILFWLSLGSIAVLWGGWQALHTQSLKRLVAWSTVAQVGYLMIGLALLAAMPTTEAWRGVLLLAVAHALAKSAMFLAAGNVQTALGHDHLHQLAYGLHRMRMTVFAFALAGVSLAGLPISLGFLAKWFLLQQAFDYQAWWLMALLLLGGLMTAAYVFRVLNLALSGQAPPQALYPVARMRHWVALTLALAAMALGMGGGYVQ